jgi:Tfp pilus assembly protein PilF
MQNPTDSFVQHALALELIKTGAEETAEKIFIEILTREPSYIGSYYHLAKLEEQLGKTDEAIDWYQRGMHAAREAGDQKTFSELRSAYEELTF